MFDIKKYESKPWQLSDDKFLKQLVNRRLPCEMVWMRNSGWGVWLSISTCPSWPTIEPSPVLNNCQWFRYYLRNQPFHISTTTSIKQVRKHVFLFPCMTVASPKHETVIPYMLHLGKIIFINRPHGTFHLSCASTQHSLFHCSSNKAIISAWSLCVSPI